uniref:Uncharacterized protein n=3 Tax=viral metagenome TaxID=1070528 RepID=A0A6M3J9Q3_9ZZZZ
MATESELKILLNAKDNASGVIKGVHGALGGIGKTIVGIAAAAGGLMVVKKAFDFMAGSVKMAAEEQVGIVKLQTSLQASYAASAASATKGAAAHTVMVAAMKPEKLAALGVEIQKVTARVNDQAAALAKAKNPTQSATLALELNRQKLAALQAQYTQGSGKIAVSVGGIAASAGKLTGTWQEASAEIEKYLASELKRTALDDGEGRESVQVLTEATGDYRQALKLLPIAQDLARAKGMDLATASQLVGKVSQGNVSILTRYGIVLKKGTTATQALAEMTKRFGGQAAAFAQTEIGASKKLEVAFGNIREAIGSPFLNVLTRAKGKLADFLTDNLPAIENFAGKMAEGIGKAVDSAGKIWDAFSRTPGDFGAKLSAAVLEGANEIGGTDLVNKVADIIGVGRALSASLSKGDWAGAWGIVSNQIITGFNAIWPKITAAWEGTSGKGVSMEGVEFDFGTVGLKEKLVGFVDKIPGWITEKLTGLSVSLEPLTAKLQAWAEDEANQTQLVQAAFAITNAIIKAIRTFITGDTTALDTLPTALQASVDKNAARLTLVGVSIGVKIGEGIVAAIAQAWLPVYQQWLNLGLGAGASGATTGTKSLPISELAKGTRGGSTVSFTFNINAPSDKAEAIAQEVARAMEGTSVLAQLRAMGVQ